MILVGLTGGIGSGKSTVGELLRARGAVIVDADAITRELQEPGSPLLAVLADRFGADVITEAGALDRALLAQRVFGDPAALRDLNRIVHPAVGAEMDRRVAAEREGERVVVLDIPLLAENPREGLQAVVVVDVPEQVQVDRLVRFRGFDAADARARIARQATRAERLRHATHVIDNSGDEATLARRVDAVWAQLRALPQLPPDVELRRVPPPEPLRYRRAGVGRAGVRGRAPRRPRPRPSRRSGRTRAAGRTARGRRGSGPS